jgi:hypothetical protein
METQSPQPQYPQYQPAPYQPPAMPKVDGLAIASLVLGLCWVYWAGSILAIIFGAVAIKRIQQSGGWRTGKGMAIAGLILGLLGVMMLVLVIIVAIANANNDPYSLGMLH